MLELIENWPEEISIEEVMHINGVTRREDSDEVDKWMCQPRVIAKCNKRTQMFFKLKGLSVRELA